VYELHDSEEGAEGDEDAEAQAAQAADDALLPRQTRTRLVHALLLEKIMIQNDEK
jgi:hypothetical protein